MFHARKFSPCFSTASEGSTCCAWCVVNPHVTYSFAFSEDYRFNCKGVTPTGGREGEGAGGVGGASCTRSGLGANGGITRLCMDPHTSK
jgi:hypothetical protein